MNYISRKPGRGEREVGGWLLCCSHPAFGCDTEEHLGEEVRGPPSASHPPTCTGNTPRGLGMSECGAAGEAGRAVLVPRGSISFRHNPPQINKVTFSSGKQLQDATPGPTSLLSAPGSPAWESQSFPERDHPPPSKSLRTRKCENAPLTSRVSQATITEATGPRNSQTQRLSAFKTAPRL